MKSLPYLLFGLLCIVPPGHASDNHTTSALPQDVKVFKDRRDACDYFRTEGPSLNKERAKELAERMKGYCAGTDKELASLKTKYKNNKTVSEALTGYAKKTE